MPRPRKDSAEPCAPERLIGAFWNLLERGGEVSVGAVAQAASCNRSTFYYHFRGIDELEDTAVRKALVESGGLADEVWKAAVTGDFEALLSYDEKNLHYLVLALESGLAPVVNEMVRSTVLDRWAEAACSEGEQLAPDATFAIQFMASGVLSLVVALGYSNEGAGQPPRISLGPSAREYLKKVAADTIEAVAAAQGLEPGHLMERLN